MRTRLVVGISLALALVFAPAAARAKNFRPGDLRLCDARTCVDVTDQDVLNALARLFYGQPSPAEMPAPRLGKPYLQLQFSNGYLTGVVAMDHFNRFLSHGVNMGQFAPGAWYRVPRIAALGLQALSSELQPLRLNRSTIRLSQ
jgi:hypothetical protein